MDKKIKVLFVSHSAKLSGAERSLLLLLKEIDKKIIEPIVVIPSYGPLKEEIESLKIKNYILKSPWWFGKRVLKVAELPFSLIRELFLLFFLGYIYKKESIDLVYTNTIVVFSGAISSFFFKKPHIWHIREIIPGNPGLKSIIPERFLFKYVYNLSYQVVTISQAVSQQFNTYNYNNNKKIVVVPNAIDFDTSFNRGANVNINGIEKGDWVVVVIGSLRRRKAQDIAIRAIAMIKDKMPNIKLLLIGSGDNKYKTYLQQLAKSMGLSDSIVFAGYRNDVPNILPICKVLLMPSLEEPFGRVIIEAMAVGLPVIASNSGGPREIIKNGITGFLVSPGNHAEIAQKILLISKSEDFRKKIGEQGMKEVEDKYLAKNYAGRIENIIIKTISDYKEVGQ
ncbi:Glycosyltransferase involved in cell wall bisynthesis [Desulfotomaculum arcticum]|uniref:Glycosyltransferase involved in cell wall bisynthesis n=1 Tax=Desulfotruncus arcticus DSM 17038 TaxID=1121424 RepID=A0A1I2Q415_9FIRM|nr:glycosyltransferase family 4 protein [Desulfotruncus arcticus]SFG22413.1 Glycosyltransferase involved in cell wall bisynthesis [Desulfotomaculum arcticum] [Desulfotruncus arcticus DSM 17038]